MKIDNKNLIIKCLISNNIDGHVYDVKIYNAYNELVLNSNTDEYGYLKCCLRCGKLYKIIITSKSLFPYKIIKKIYIGKSEMNKLYFIFTKPIFKRLHPITIRITDQNYNGLPIMKGKIILWQNT